MAHKQEYSRRLLRELGKDPDRLLESRSYRDPGFFALFLGSLDQRIFENPQRALPWSKRAPALARLVPVDGRAVEHRSRIALALASLGGAYRAAGNLREAEKAYVEITELGKLSELAAAEIDRRRSTLLVCQGRTEQALDLVVPAVDVLREHEAPSLAEALVSLGYALYACGWAVEAMDTYSEALDLADKSAAGQRVTSAAVNNLSATVAEIGHVSDLARALKLMARTDRSLGRQCAERHFLEWTRGHISERLGSHTQAERLYLRAMVGFEKLSLAWESSLVGLDLAKLHHFLGDREAVQAVAARTAKYFRLNSGAHVRTLSLVTGWADALRTASFDTAKHAEARKAIETVVYGGSSCKSRRR